MESQMSDALNWIECERCEDWILFENTGIKMPYSKESASNITFVCRVCILEERIQEREAESQTLKSSNKNELEALKVKMVVLESLLQNKEIETRNYDIIVIEKDLEKSKVIALELLLQNREIEARNCERLVHEKDEEIHKLTEIIVDLKEQINVNINQGCKNEWCKNRSKMDIEEKSKIMSDKVDDILIIGGSSVRVVGTHLKQQTDKFVTSSYKGAKIEDITKRIKERNSKSKKIVVMTGANNLMYDGTVDIVRKFDNLIETVRTKFEDIVIIGLLPRNDLGGCYYESKRIGINSQVEKKCKTRGIQFIDCMCYSKRNKFLCNDGLHLNNLGADTLGRIIFKTLN